MPLSQHLLTNQLVPFGSISRSVRESRSAIRTGISPMHRHVVERISQGQVAEKIVIRSRRVLGVLEDWEVQEQALVQRNDKEDH